MKSVVLMLMSLVFVIGCEGRKNILADESNKEHQKRISQKKGQKQAAANVNANATDESNDSKAQQPRVFEPAKNTPETDVETENTQKSKDQEHVADAKTGDETQFQTRAENVHPATSGPAPAVIEAPTAPTSLNPPQQTVAQAPASTPAPAPVPAQTESKTPPQAQLPAPGAAPASQQQVDAPAAQPASTKAQDTAQSQTSDSQANSGQGEDSPEVLTLEEFNFIRKALREILKGDAIGAARPVNTDGVLARVEGTLEGVNIQLAKAGKILAELKDLKIQPQAPFQGKAGDLQYGGFPLDPEVHLAFITFLKVEDGKMTFNFPIILKRIGTQIVGARFKPLEQYTKESEALKKAQAENEKASKTEGTVSDSSDVKQ